SCGLSPRLRELSATSAPPQSMDRCPCSSISPFPQREQGRRAQRFCEDSREPLSTRPENLVTASPQEFLRSARCPYFRATAASSCPPSSFSLRAAVSAGVG